MRIVDFWSFYTVFFSVFFFGKKIVKGYEINKDEKDAFDFLGEYGLDNYQNIDIRKKGFFNNEKCAKIVGNLLSILPLILLPYE